MADDLGSTEREIVAQRIKKAEALRKLAVNPYGNGFTPRHLARDLKARYGSQTAEEIARDPETWSVAGRCLAVRSFGKAAFLRVRDRSGDLQVWVKKDKVGERGFEVFQLLDVGDLVAAEGPATRTKTGELTVEAASFTILTKAIRPLPEKWHGLADVEARYRQRYLDLVVTEGVRQNFERRAAIVRTIRRFLDDTEYDLAGAGLPPPAPDAARAQGPVHGRRAVGRYTHLQRAQPVLLAHHLLAYFEMFQRDIERFQQCLERTDVLPLGSGALAGVPYPVDRSLVTKELGFSKVSANSIDAVSDRDFVIEYEAVASITMMTSPALPRSMCSGPRQSSASSR